MGLTRPQEEASFDIYLEDLRGIGYCCEEG